MKKILIVVIILLLVTGGVGIYIYLSKNSGALSTVILPSDLPVEGGGEANIENGLENFNLVTSEVLKFFWLDDGAEAYGVNSLGQIIKINSPREFEILSFMKMKGVFFASASPVGGEVIIGFKDGGEIAFRLFNTLSKTWRSLPEKTVSAVWSQDGKHVGYLSKIVSGLAINTLNIDNGAGRRVLQVNMGRASLLWPEEKTMYLLEPPSGVVPTRVLRIDLVNNTLAVAQEKLGLIADLYKNSELLAFSGESGLFAFDRDGSQTRAWNKVVTIPQKCAVSDDFLFCGVSKNLAFSDFPDKYLQKIKYSDDSFQISELDSNSFFSPIISSYENTPLIDVWRPIIKNGIVYFINRYDGNLYSLSLSQN